MTTKVGTGGRTSRRGVGYCAGNMKERRARKTPRQMTGSNGKGVKVVRPFSNYEERIEFSSLILALINDLHSSLSSL